MSMKRFAALCAFFLSLPLFLPLSLPPSSAQAQALRDVEGPVNYPPSSFKGKQFVDNEGCAYVRAGIDGRVNWIPRVSRSRKLLCGLKPTFSGAEANITSAQIAKAPVQITNPETAEAATPAPVAAPVSAPVAAPAPQPAAKPAVAKVKPVTPAAPAKAAKARVVDATPTTRPAPKPKPKVQQARLQPAPKPAPKPAPQPAPLLRQQTKVAPAPAATPAQTARSATTCQNFKGISLTYAGSGPRARCGTQSQSTSRKQQAQKQARKQPAANPFRLFRPRQSGKSPTDQAQSGQTRVVPRHVYDKQQRSNVGGKIPKGYRKAWDDDRLNPNRARMTVEGIRQSDLIWTRTIPRKLYIKDTGRVVTPLFPDLRYPYTSMDDQNAAMGLTASSRNTPAAAGRYVQVGVFAVETNANRAAQQILAAGLPARFGTLKKGRQSYRVVLAGPFTSDQVMAAVATARRAGFSDAYAR